MLNIIQMYMHGYVAVPLATACHRRGMFAAIDARPGALCLNDLSARWEANPGHLAVALQVFETLDWISVDRAGRYSPGPKASVISRIPEELADLILTQTEGCVCSNRTFKPLKRLLLQSIGNWGGLDEVWTRFFDGCLVIPLVVAGCGDNTPTTWTDFRGLCSTDERRRIFREWFSAKGWLADSNLRREFSELGKFIFERRLIMGSVYSYRPMISQVDALLFGDAATVFGTHLDGRERHVERGLNVVSSGFQHERYFQDLDQTLRAIFDGDDFASQPRYVADMGCGDGTLLRRIYQTVAEKTARGRNLELHPLVLIGVDFNAAALEQCRKTLKGLPQILLAGDIGDPARMMQDLRAQGVEPQQVLHIRSFLDHDRHLSENAPAVEGLAPLAKVTTSIHVARDGSRISPAVSLGDLARHLGRWADVINQHGLLLFEVHCLPPALKKAHLEDVESLHFDAYHSFSGQMLVEADIFLLAGASVGLFPKFEHGRRYPKLLDFTRITFNHFVRHDYIIRHARPEDARRLADLDMLPSLGDANRANEDETREYFVREREGRIDGAFAVGRITGARVGVSPAFGGEQRLSGSEYWCIAMSDAPVADRAEQETLLRFALHLTSLRVGGQEVLVAIKCPQHSGADSGYGGAPQLRFYGELGGELCGIIDKGSTLSDRSLEGCAIFRFKLRTLAGAEPKASAQLRDNHGHASDRAGMLSRTRKFLQETINQLLDSPAHTTIDGDTALADLGLDSMDLIEFRSTLAAFARTELTTTFFFNYPTINKIAEALVSAMPLLPALPGDVPAAHQGLSEPAVPEGSERELTPPGFRDADVAIVGMACRFPGDVKTPEALWSLLLNKIDPIGQFPADRATRDDFFQAAETTGRRTILTGGFLQGIENFDNELFGLSPRESEWMDPQQRILLQLVWEALEAGGLNPDALRGSDTSVFAAAFSSDYERLQGRAGGEQSSAYFGTGSCTSMLAGRISYQYGFQGPAISVNTACSSSLVAIHYACRSLLDRECSLAVAGSTNLIVQPDYSLSFASAGMLSATGRCKPFDASADGFVRSEGAGVLLLKRVQDAVRDGDRIWAVIRGSVVNQDGASNGLTAPNGKAQERLLREGLKRAGVAPADIAFFESHGTGTPLGDPIEWTAIHSVYGGREEPLAIGSVKSNIGHCEAASGMAGVMKAVLALRHRAVPPNLHFTSSNPQIALDAIPAVIPTEVTPLRSASSQPLRAAVSSFGFSGTNAHLVIEEFREEARRPGPENGAPHLIPFSAKSPERLRALLACQVEFLEANGRDFAGGLRDLAFTLQAGRSALEERVCFIASSGEELRDGLRAHLEGRKNPVPVFQGNSERDFVRIQLFEEEFNAGQLVGRWVNQAHWEKIAAFWVAGGKVEWTLLHSGEKPRRLALPTYPFAAKPFWVQASSQASGSRSDVETHPLLQRNVSTLQEQAYESRLTSTMPIFRDHRVGSESILPAVCYLEMVRAAAARESTANAGIAISQVVWSRPIAVRTESTEARLVLRPDAGGSMQWEIFVTSSGGTGEERISCAKGKVVPASPAREDAGSSIEDIRSRCPTYLAPATFYGHCRDAGFNYGGSFQTVKGIWGGTTELLAEIETSDLETSADRWGWPAGLFDGAIQPIIVLGMRDAKSAGVPFALERVEMPAVLPRRFFSHVSRRSPPGAIVQKYDIVLRTASGERLGRLHGLSVAPNNQRSGPEIPPAPPDRTNVEPGVTSGELLKTRAEDFLREVVARACGTAIETIRTDQPLDTYGIDSIAIMTMTELLEGKFGPLSKTILFECKTLGQLTDYFLVHHSEKLREALGTAGDASLNNARKPGLAANSRISAPRFASRPQSRAKTDIAIVGVAGRYPQARDLDEFWENLKNARDCVTDVPAERWSRAAHPLRRARSKNAREGDRGGFIEDVDRFDSLFFNIAPSEAELLDPQQRLFLETAWAALEDAGYTRNAFRGGEAGRLGRNVGVYVGVMYREYAYLGLQAGPRSGARTIPWTDPSSIANRVSYFCDFHGPSMAIDTMCSSSLSCVHLACESIRHGSCDAALAGGVNVSIHPYKYDHLEQLGFLSPTGRCASFGVGGEGYIPGEGVGCMLLKPLANAESDGDHIYGVIRATALNHGGRANGYTVPNPNAQADLIAQALAYANLDPELITYVEAHGTGTALGDPIEFKALQQTYGHSADGGRRCALGSVKSNIGHCEAAAGIAGITKVLLQMKHGTLVPSLHAEALNPNIPFERSRFVVQRDLAPWRRPDLAGSEQPRVAAVSAFGAGGSNAHVIIQEYEAEGPAGQDTGSPAEPRSALIVLSAMDEGRLREYARRLQLHLAKCDFALERIAWTLQVGREAYKARLAILASDRDELSRRLSDWLQGRSSAQEVFEGSDLPRTRAPGATWATGQPEQDEIGRWLDAGELARVAAHWVSGGVVDWRRLYRNGVPRKVSLPSYPFARLRHWLNVSAVRSEAAPAMAHEETHLRMEAVPETAELDRAEVVAWLRSTLAQQLKIEADILTADSPLRDFGVDSILLLEWVESLETSTRIKLDPVVMLEYPTLAKLADYLMENHGAALVDAAVGVKQTKPGNSTIVAKTRDATVPPSAAAVADAGGAPKLISGSGHSKVAIVGMACHFPDAGNLEQYWSNLRSGRDCVRQVPANRWDLKRFFSATPAENMSISRWGGFLDDIRAFDPDYFGIEESLARHLDPLARQWLEVSAEALADAGYGKRDLWGESVGVFAGSRVSNFHAKVGQYNRNSVLGLGQNSITALLSHFYNFKGPSLVVDSACSGSLSSVHLAVASLLSGESTMALAGGVDILLDEYAYLVMSAAHMLSPDGRCKTMDESANGIVLGEGCGVLLLKTLNDAIADKNKIYGVIEGTALNSDGYSMGIATPDPKGQQAVIEGALHVANVEPASVGYVEMHGTGTLLGDAIELRALSSVFDRQSGGLAQCGVGSAKSNLGHLLSAGGVAGLIKVVLSMVHRELPPTLHCDRPNPRHNFAGTRLFPVRSLQRWEPFDGVLRAGVSAFGLGGCNAHLVVSNQGVPVERAAGLKPLGAPVRFARRELWPSAEDKPSADGDDIADDGAFLEMFKMVPL